MLRHEATLDGRNIMKPDLHTTSLFTNTLATKMAILHVEVLVQSYVLLLATLAIAAVVVALHLGTRAKTSRAQAKNEADLPPILDLNQTFGREARPRHLAPQFSQPAWVERGVFRLESSSDSSWLSWLQLLPCTRPASVTIVLNNAKAASDLLDIRSAIYSDRPAAVTGNQLRSHGLSVPFTPYGHLFRRHRRAFTAAFARASVPRYDDNVRSDLLALLRTLTHHSAQTRSTDSNHDWFQHLYRFVTSQTMHTTYGRRVENLDTDAFVLTAKQCNENFFAMNKPSGFLVDRMPFLASLPFCINPWKQMCEPWFQKELHLL